MLTEWSAPSAIGIAGLGGGFEVGAEVDTVFLSLFFRRYYYYYSNSADCRELFRHAETVAQHQAVSPSVRLSVPCRRIGTEPA